MKLNNPVLIELIETAVNQRAIVQMNDMSARVTFLYSPVVFYIGYGFDEPVPLIWLDSISSETRITPDEFKTLLSRYSYYRGFS
ncbi:hypothetical protein H2549_000352 [Salmonella enterica subsp. enterica serovar Stanley]|nr:hypothetical protein [Salmonella enterica subsp. enterica serovar Stanley]